MRGRLQWPVVEDLIIYFVVKGMASLFQQQVLYIKEIKKRYKRNTRQYQKHM